MGALDLFSPRAKAWFEASFAAPTPAQQQGWEAISRGDHTLILAPTGSGKTLAAFFWALDRVAEGPKPDDERKRCRVLYVSPLKALAYDVDRNLRAPLFGMGAVDVNVGVRTGDTDQKARRAMARHPPDILVTTPESLYLMLTSAVREILASVEYVIIDEIHAMAGTKRGAHLALSLERLDSVIAAASLAEGGSRIGAQRIGLSATQRPLEEVARFLGGPTRQVSIVDAGVRKQLDLEVIVPVADMGQLGKPIETGGEVSLGGPASGEPEQRHSIWPSVHGALLDLIRSHNSTLIFVNSRRLSERLSSQLNELAGEELVRAHHGSVAREQRMQIEDSLKAGTLPALVATSSLELGIDMGAIDLVVQVEAPSSVASGLQRIGRAGHQVGEPSKGKMFPKFRGDLVVAAVTAQRMQRGLIEATRVPRNPLDVLAQQLVAMVAVEDWRVDDAMALVQRAYSFSELTTDAFEGVLDMLSGRYPSDEFAELRPRIIWDRVEGVISARPGARMLAVTSGGTIPDRGLFAMVTPDGNRVGELDEEYVYESRVGETMVLGATTWRIEDITRDRVVVTPAPGRPGKMPFWHGDAIGRPYELGKAIGAFLRGVDSWSDDKLREECGLDPLATSNLRAYLAEEREATGGVLPTDRQIVIERFQDELGDWRVCVLSPFGARVHAPWSLALEARVRDRLGLEVQAIWDDDGIVLRLPEADDSPPIDSIILEPEEIDDLLVDAAGSSALFASRFRENAARALLLPRRRPGSRTPLWQTRQRAADLLAVASKYGEFPILLETYREVLSDVFDVPSLRELMSDIRSRKIRVVAVDTPVPSPFASALAFRYVSSFMYEGDAPLAERRAAALTLDRRMLAELLGADELRELIDNDALTQLELELQLLDDSRRARTVDAAHDVLRRLGDLTEEELLARTMGDGFAEELVRSRRAVRVRIAGEERLIAAEDAARYRDGAGVVIPAGVPEAFLQPVADALDQLVRRWARTHGPFLTPEPALRLGVDLDAVAGAINRLVGAETIERGAFRPDGTEAEWCDSEVLRRLRQRSLAALRKEIEPTDPEALGRFLPAWHGVGSDARGIDRLYEVISQLQGLPIPASVLESDVLPSRVRNYEPRMLDELCGAGEVTWVGAGSLGHSDGKVMVFLRGAELARTAPVPSAPPGGDEHVRLRDLLATSGAAFFSALRGADERETLASLWDLVWAGEVTNDSFAPVRALGGTVRKRSGRPGRSASRRPRLGSLSTMGPPSAQGRWSLVERGGVDPTRAAHARAAALLERHGVLTREAVRGEGLPGGFAAVYPVLRAMEEAGRIRRGYFIAGLGGAQFALPGAVDRLRAAREPGIDGSERGTIVLAATDPANPYGITVPWPDTPDDVSARPMRAAGAYVAMRDGQPVLWIERRGRGLAPLRAFDGEWEQDAVAAVAAMVGPGRPFKRLVVERVPDGLETVLRNAGFTPTPKGWTLYG